MTGFAMTTMAVVTAAGLSSRMGVDKPLLELGGSTMLRLIVSAFAQAGAAEVAVVTGHHARQVREHVADMPLARCLYNPLYAQSDMFYSVCLGIRQVYPRCHSLFICPVDSPLFQAESLAVMENALHSTGADVVIPSYQGRKGHPLLIASHAAASLLDYSGEGGLRQAIRSSNLRVHIQDLPDPGLVMSANIPEDFARLLQYSGGRREQRLRQAIPCRYPVMG